MWDKFCDKDRLGCRAEKRQSKASLWEVRGGVPGVDCTELSLERWAGVSCAEDPEGQDRRMVQRCLEAEPTGTAAVK